MSVTTIKVDSNLRDRLAELAVDKGRTLGSTIEFLLEEYLWAQRMEAVRVAMANASEEDLRTYHEESEWWGQFDADGLEGW